MKIQTFNLDKLFYAQVDEFYSQEELALLQKEINFLESIKQESDKTNTATKDGKSLKKGYGIFVDDVYKDRVYSTILTLNRKLFDENLVDELVKSSCFYEHIKRSNSDSTLLNFYGSDGVYDSHADTSIFTALTFFKIGNFQGGNLTFKDYGVSIEPVVGRMIVFPGCVLHKAEPVIAEPGNYRVTMAQFVSYK